MHEVQFNPKKFSFTEAYVIFFKGFRASIHAALSNARKEIHDEFQERIMLAVTQVNGCEICSYYHSKIALEKGLGQEEIQMLISGNSENIPPEESIAILFAQHYADTGGHPTKTTWDKLVEIYGKVKADQILSYIQIMMMGNVMGIPLSSFMNRLKGKPAGNSSLAYELLMIVAPALFFPVALIHVLISELIRAPRICFFNSPERV
jgi:AhpD family alkylhydroperoxidase